MIKPITSSRVLKRATHGAYSVELWRHALGHYQVQQINPTGITRVSSTVYWPSAVKAFDDNVIRAKALNEIDPIPTPVRRDER